jgi:hypothetical protein
MEANDPIQPIRRSVSLSFSLCQNQISIADILRISEEDEDGDGVGILNLVTSPFLQEDLCSQGRFMFYDFKLMSI